MTLLTEIFTGVPEIYGYRVILNNKLAANYPADEKKEAEEHALMIKGKVEPIYTIE